MNEKKKKIIIGTVIGLLLLAVLIFLLWRIFTPKEYVITFDSAGGSNVASIKVKANHKIPKPEDPTKENDRFGGWYYEDKLFDFETKVTKDMTLVAYWKSSVIVIDTNAVNLVVGSSKQIGILSLPEDYSINSLEYESSDPSIASVDENGNITALKKGTVTITIKTRNGDFKTECVVTITEEEIAVESITVSGNNTLTVGSSTKLNVSFQPQNATNKTVTWQSSNSSIATVDQNGTVKALKEGKVTITATTENGKTASKTMTIEAKKTTPNVNPNENTPQNPGSEEKEPTGGNTGTEGGNTEGEGNKPSEGTDKPTPPADVSPTNISVSTSNVNLEENKSTTVTYTISPSNATNKSVTWKSNGPSIATVDQSGKITGVSAGSTTVTVCSNAKTDLCATISVTVTKKPDSYRVEFTKVSQEGTGNVMQYTFVVYKNNQLFEDYTLITCGGTPATKGNHINMSTESNDVKIKLSSGEVVSATATYK